MPAHTIASHCEPIRTSSRGASTVKVERRAASNTFTARSERYNESTDAIYLVIAVRAMSPSTHVYEVRPRADKRGFDLIGKAVL